MKQTMGMLSGTDVMQGGMGIRFAVREDIPAIMEFIEEYWAHGHILAHDRELFDFQYVYGDEVCFVLQENPKSGSIESVLGYIPYGTEGERDIFSAIWKVGKKDGFLPGMELIRFLEAHGRCRNLLGVGLATGAVSMMKYLRKKIGDFEHYYRLNPAVSEFRIAEIKTIPPSKPVAEASEPADAEQVPAFDMGGKQAPGREEQEMPIWHRVRAFEEIEEAVETWQTGRVPWKSAEFVRRRYFAHPEYVYEAWHIAYGGRDGLLICRAQEAEGRSIYRIIDLIGDVSVLAGTEKLFAEQFAEHGYEYVDCLVYGMDEVVMKKAGFTKRTEADGNIIPNYFEPFERRNITIHNYMPKQDQIVMFRGDGDQDRPSIRKKG